MIFSRSKASASLISFLLTGGRIIRSFHWSSSTNSFTFRTQHHNLRQIDIRSISHIHMPSRQGTSSHPPRRSLRIRQARSRLFNDASEKKELVESSINEQKKKRKLENNTSASKRSKKKNVSSSDVPAVEEKSKVDTPELETNQSHSEVSNERNEEHLLLDLGKLVKGRLVKRPSATVRSPYVSDVVILNDDDDGEEITVLAHSPALDVGGLCAPGATVYMSERPPGGKTSHSIELILAPAPNKAVATNEEDGVLIGSHPRLGESLAEEVLKKGLLKDVIGYGPARKNTQRKKTATKKKKTTSKKRKAKKQDTNADENSGDDPPKGVMLTTQCTYGDSRVDFEIVDYSNKSDTEHSLRSLIEVKNVVCSDVAAEFAPEKRGPNHCVIIADGEESKSVNSSEYKRTGIFPWGRVGQEFEGKKVVSERAIKHLRNLSNLVSNDPQIKAAIVMFVINRSDCEMMRACHEACPTFASELRAASDNGCTVLGFRVHWTTDGKAYFDGIVPVTL